jgi:hypothetical protein
LFVKSSIIWRSSQRFCFWHQRKRKNQMGGAKFLRTMHRILIQPIIKLHKIAWGVFTWAACSFIAFIGCKT